MILITLMLAVLVLTGSMPFVVQAVSMVFLALWGIGLLYLVIKRW